MGNVLFCRKITFQASHYYRLPGEDADQSFARFGPVSNTHEHHWGLTIWLRGPLNPVTGMVVDLDTVDQILEREILLPFRGKVINDADPFFKTALPTTEVLAEFFAERLAPHFRPVELVRLRLSESEDLFSEWHV